MSFASICLKQTMNKKVQQFFVAACAQLWGSKVDSSSTRVAAMNDGRFPQRAPSPQRVQ